MPASGGGARSQPSGGAPPPGRPPAKAPCKALAHFAWAPLNWALFVFSPLVLKTGAFPDVFGAGRLTPLARMQAANVANALVRAGLSKACSARAKFAAPHFFTAASN